MTHVSHVSSERVLRMSHRSGLPLVQAHDLIKAFKNKDAKKLAITAEKFLITADQNEGLKERGLTVFDALEGGFGTKDEDFIYSMFNEWDNRLGEDVYGYVPIPGKDD
jgi:hypothetical protein